MTSYAFVAPILPGKLDAWKRLCAEVSGPRKSQHVQARQRAGVTRELVWLQQTPQGDMAIVYWDADDPGRAMQYMATSSDPHDRWFVEQAKEIHGIDLTQAPPPPNTLTTEWRV